jgi:hypothetical protein
MNSDLQREAMSLLGEVWSLSPDVRLGQLFAHLGFLGESHLGRGLGCIDDDELMAILNRHRDELLARLEGTQNQVRRTDRAASGILPVQASGAAKVSEAGR